MINGYGMFDSMHTMYPHAWIMMVLLWGFAVFGLVCAIRWLVVHARHDKDRK